ncbi:hypothetical protein; putative membrane protein [Frankia alni ACN14a]|uniref:Uncharacterized protein n=1 Tax=Frankia alni (strain DSM 45986 / CECT 9034 / ACN14a) TaxID=326424 RepID=Q0RKZ8_FRAAA|nr:hypothetical protein; putative membrane protein [Frankia alni ACN14a]
MRGTPQPRTSIGIRPLRPWGQVFWPQGGGVRWSVRVAPFSAFIDFTSDARTLGRVQGDLFSPRRHGNGGAWILLVVGCYLLGEMGEIVGVPAPQLVVPLLVGAFLALGGMVRRNLPAPTIRGSQAVLGVLMGSYLNISELRSVLGTALPLTAVTLATIALCLLAALLFTRTSRGSVTDAALGMMPGGSAAIVACAEELRADSRLVALSQYLRVGLVAVTAPAVVAVSHGTVGRPRPGSFPAYAHLVDGSSQLLGLAFLPGVCLLGARAGRRLGLPAPALPGLCGPGLGAGQDDRHRVPGVLPGDHSGRHQRGARHRHCGPRRRRCGLHRSELPSRPRGAADPAAGPLAPPPGAAGQPRPNPRPRRTRGLALTPVRRAGRTCGSGPVGAAEHGPGGGDPQVVECVGLPAGPLEQHVETVLVERVVTVGDGTQGAPGGRLARDPDPQCLQLDHRAQRGAAHDPAVGLQPARRLGEPAGRDLVLPFGDAEGAHQLEQRLAVLGDLRGHPGQRVAGGCSAMGRRRAAGEPQPGGGAGQVVVQVDAEWIRAGLRPGHPTAGDGLGPGVTHATPPSLGAPPRVGPAVGVSGRARTNPCRRLLGWAAQRQAAVMVGEGTTKAMLRMV